MYRQIIGHPGLNADKVILIRNAIPNEEFFFPEQRDPCREELGLTSNAIVLGTIGRIRKSETY